MKKIILTLALVMAVSVNAQEKNPERKNQMSMEQRNELHLKKMTLDLDLSPAQQKEIAQLMKEESSKRASKKAEMKANSENKKELTADEKFKIQNERLDNQIAHKAKMRKILNDQQFEKWEKNQKRRQHAMTKKRMNHKKGHKKEQQAK